MSKVKYWVWFSSVVVLLCIGAATTNRTPLLRAVLQGAMDAGGNAITNASEVRSTNFTDAASGSSLLVTISNALAGSVSAGDPTGTALAATNGLAIANTNRWDPLSSALNATNTARLAVNLASSFDALNAALNATNTARLATQLAATFDALNAALNATNTARLVVNLGSSFDAAGVASTGTNQLAIANTNLWDPINSALNATNAARLAANLASSFDALNAALNATNTARLTVNLANAFDALNAALNSTNGITSDWVQGKFPGVIMTNGGTVAIVYSNGIAIDKAHSLTLSNLTASRVLLSAADNTLASAAGSGAVPIDADGSATTAAQINTLLAGTNPNLNGTATTNSIVAKAVNYTLTATDWMVLLNGSLAATLPTAVGAPGKVYIIKCVSSGTNAILTTSSQTIDGAAKWTNTAINKFTWVVSDNANWRVIGQN